MREIKFRAWDDADGVHRDEGWMSYGITNIACDADHIMQYTGKKDKNGKEIYEGDVWERGQYIGIVTFEFSGWKLKKAESSRCYSSPSFYSNANSGEVIGNIYENPELLGNDKEGR